MLYLCILLLFLLLINSEAIDILNMPKWRRVIAAAAVAVAAAVAAAAVAAVVVAVFLSVPHRELEREEGEREKKRAYEETSTV